MNKPGEQTLTIDQAISLAVEHHTQGRLPEAESLYNQILQVDPNNPFALHLLGVIAHQVGKNDIALDLISKALVHKPVFPEARNNLGNVYKVLGKLEDAKSQFMEALSLNPNFADAHNNLGTILELTQNLNEAAESYRKAINLNPDFATALNNLGNVLTSLRRLEEAREFYQKAIAANPGYVEAYNNLGNALKDLGKLKESVASYCQALSMNPVFAPAWHNIRFPARALQFQKRETAANILSRLSPEARATTDFVLLDYYLTPLESSESIDKADENFLRALKSLPPKEHQTLVIGGTGDASALPDKMVSLLHFGRSGTGLLHSLIDNHPEISTTPGIYLRGYFNAGVWETLIANGWQQLPERFAEMFDVLFDANSTAPTPGRLGDQSTNLGYEEGMTQVGDNRDEILQLDRQAFLAEAHRLLEGMDQIDPMSFLMIVHGAYEKALGTATEKNTVFYHIHNPDDYATLNFYRYAPHFRQLMMVREPVQNCESWVRPYFEKNDYESLAARIFDMLYALDRPSHRRHGTVGLRLEDLKEKPDETLKTLCDWLGVSESPTLYEMTAQGKKWWGDPTSPDYSKSQAMDPFDPVATQRTVGTIFSERDQRVLHTLFYPFSVKFGYREADPAGFARNLRDIRPMLDDVLDFEATLCQRQNISTETFKQTCTYLFLRAGMVDRWNTLNRYKDYPNMLSPL